MSSLSRRMLRRRHRSNVAVHSANLVVTSSSTTAELASMLRGVNGIVDLIHLMREIDHNDPPAWRAIDPALLAPYRDVFKQLRAMNHVYRPLLRVAAVGGCPVEGAAFVPEAIWAPEAVQLASDPSLCVSVRIGVLCAAASTDSSSIVEWILGPDPAAVRLRDALSPADLLPLLTSAVAGLREAGARLLGA